MQFELRHRFAVPPDVAWDELFGDAYESAVAADAKLQRKVLSDTTQDGRRVRRIHVVPDQRLPAPVAKVIGSDRFSYVLEERHDRAANRMDWTVTPDGLSDRVDVRGTWKLQAVPGGCERIVTIEIKVRIPVVGGRIEQQIGADLRKNYEDAAVFAQRWLEKAAKEDT